MFAITDRTWLTEGAEKKKGRRKISGGGDGTAPEDGARAVDGFPSFVAGGGFAFGSLTLVWLEEDTCLLIDDYVIAVEFSKAVNDVHDVIEEVDCAGV